MKSESRKRNLAMMQADPNDKRHGTPTGYSYGCRCEACKQSYSIYSKKLWEMKRQKKMRYKERGVALRNILDSEMTAKNTPYAKYLKKRCMDLHDLSVRGNLKYDRIIAVLAGKDVPTVMELLTMSRIIDSTMEDTLQLIMNGGVNGSINQSSNKKSA